MEAVAATLLALLLEEDGVSIHKACKRLALAMSEMMRLLTALGGLVEQREERGRMCLFLTAQGRAHFAEMQRLG